MQIHITGCQAAWISPSQNEIKPNKYPSERSTYFTVSVAMSSSFLGPFDLCAECYGGRKSGENPDEFHRCSNCPRVFHSNCLQPNEKPHQSNWKCEKCPRSVEDDNTGEILLLNPRADHLYNFLDRDKGATVNFYAIILHWEIHMLHAGASGYILLEKLKKIVRNHYSALAPLIYEGKNSSTKKERKAAEAGIEKLKERFLDELRSIVGVDEYNVMMSVFVHGPTPMTLAMLPPYTSTACDCPASSHRRFYTFCHLCEQDFLPNAPTQDSFLQECQIRLGSSKKVVEMAAAAGFNVRKEQRFAVKKEQSRGRGRPKKNNDNDMSFYAGAAAAASSHHHASSSSSSSSKDAAASLLIKSDINGSSNNSGSRKRSHNTSFSSTSATPFSCNDTMRDCDNSPTLDKFTAAGIRAIHAFNSLSSVGYSKSKQNGSFNGYMGDQVDTDRTTHAHLIRTIS